LNPFGEVRHIYLEHGNYIKEKPVKGEIKVVQFSHSDWKISPERVGIFKKLQKDADAAGINLVIISAPLALNHTKKIKSNKHMKLAFKEYKKVIFDVFKEVHDYSTDEMAKYNTTEYFRNSTHPSKKLSRLVLEQIWSKE
jgi:hypothetical protein